MSTAGAGAADLGTAEQVTEHPLAPDTQQRVFPREASAGEGTEHSDGAMSILHLHMGVGSCQKLSQSLPRKAIASTSMQLGMSICLCSRENCYPVPTLLCDSGGLATTCRPQRQT